MSNLLIGGAGFIGAYLARELLCDGEQVSIYDRDVRHSPILELLGADELARLSLLSGDVTDPVHLLRTIGEVKPRRIVHLAAVLTPSAQADPASAVRVITLGTLHVLEATRLLGVERVVWASSAQVFGPLDRYRQRHGVELIVDDSTPDPTTIYGACKAQAELLAAHYAHTWGLDVTGLRPCGVLGPGRRAGATFEVFELVRRVAQGEQAVARRADWVFPLMHISDVVAAFLAALRRPTRGNGHTYNLGGIPTTFRELTELLQMMVPSAIIEIEESPTAPVAMLDASGIQRDLAFSLRYSLAEAVAELLEHS